MCADAEETLQLMCERDEDGDVTLNTTQSAPAERFVPIGNFFRSSPLNCLLNVIIIHQTAIETHMKYL